MRSIGLTTDNLVEIISAYSATSQQIPAVASAPAWFVLGSFSMPAGAPAKLDVIGVVSAAGLVLHVRLFDLTDAEPVGGTDVEIDSQTVESRVTSGVVQLPGGHVYQVQAEVIGTADPAHFGVVRCATLT